VISPIFGASRIEHRTKVMPAAMWMGGPREDGRSRHRGLGLAA
jgi:hypothetical protein